MRAKQVARRCHMAGIDIVLSGEGQQQGFVSGEVIEDAKQEIRFAGGLADGFRPDAGQRQKTAQLLGLTCDETQRRNGEGSRGVMLAFEFRCS
jgi:hypothetical protein